MRKTKNWYTIWQKDLKNPLYRISKFDEDLNILDSYTLTDVDHKVMLCSCFAMHRDTCRHRKMLDIFRAEGQINSGNFYDYDNKRWMEKSDL